MLKLSYEPPKKVKHKGVIYDVNDSAFNILEAITLISNEEIDDIERAIIAVVKIFGREAPISQGLVNKAFEIINNGEVAEETIKKQTKQSMDLVQDFDVYRMDILREFNHDIRKQPTSWNMLRSYIANLSQDSNLHGLSKIRTFDLKEIKDKKERKKIKELQKQVEIKNVNKKEVAYKPTIWDMYAEKNKENK